MENKNFYKEDGSFDIIQPLREYLKKKGVKTMYDWLRVIKKEGWLTLTNEIKYATGVSTMYAEAFLYTSSQLEIDDLGIDLENNQETQKLRTALQEVGECIDSFYACGEPRMLLPVFRDHAGSISVIDQVVREALKIDKE